MRLSIICRARSTFRRPKAKTQIPVGRWKSRRMTTATFVHWPSNFGATRSSKLVFFRVYSGTLSKGDTVYNPRTNKRERISRLIQIQADKREDIETCYSGDIAAIVGIKNI